jgi:hypothetical protein
MHLLRQGAWEGGQRAMQRPTGMQEQAARADLTAIDPSAGLLC